MDAARPGQRTHLHRCVAVLFVSRKGSELIDGVSFEEATEPGLLRVSERLVPIVRLKPERPKLRRRAVKLEGHLISAFARPLCAEDCRRLLLAGTGIHQQHTLPRRRPGFHFEQAPMRVDYFCEGLLSQEPAVHHVKLDLYRHLQRHTLASSPSVRLDSLQQSVSLRLNSSCGHHAVCSQFAPSSLESSASSGEWLKCFEFQTLSGCFMRHGDRSVLIFFLRSGEPQIWEPSSNGCAAQRQIPIS